MLQDLIASNLSAFLLVFMRFGLALMIMPGIGDSFVAVQVRLLFALAASFVLAPFLAPGLPPLPSGSLAMFLLLASEALCGIFIGTVMRVMAAALDTAGAVVSFQSGLSNAMLFNPETATQGSVTGAFYTLAGVTLLMVTDMHHLMLASVVESYKNFPAHAAPDFATMSESIGRAVTLSFRIGVQMAMPLLVIGTLVQAGFGLLSRLMPQLQIFFLTMPAQVFLGLLVFALTLSVCMMYWLDGFGSILVPG